MILYKQEYLQTDASPCLHQIGKISRNIYYLDLG